MTRSDGSREGLIALLTTAHTEGSERIGLLLEQLSAQAAAERDRSADLSSALALAKAELEVARAQREAAIDDLREATARETRLRDELTALRSQYQQIVDTQTLQLLELTRELATQTAPAVTPAPRARVRTGMGEDADEMLSFDGIEAALAASPL